MGRYLKAYSESKSGVLPSDARAGSLLPEADDVTHERGRLGHDSVSLSCPQALGERSGEQDAAGDVGLALRPVDDEDLPAVDQRILVPAHRSERGLRSVRAVRTR